jgi:polyisoprenoid-binding protein YceI
MKKKILIPILGLLLCGIVTVACKKDKPLTSEKLTDATTKEGEIMKLDVAESKVEWKGYKVFKSENTSHFGTLKFKSGEVTVKDNQLESGKWIVDISSLENVDLKDDAEQKAKLEGHLKSGDFFEIEKYPTAEFEITKVSKATDNSDYNTVIEGNLTLKGITKPISLKANVMVNGKEINIATEPTDIKREDFGVKFQIPVANGMIKNEVTLQALIKARA